MQFCISRFRFSPIFQFSKFLSRKKSRPTKYFLHLSYADSLLSPQPTHHSLPSLLLSPYLAYLFLICIRDEDIKAKTTELSMASRVGVKKWAVSYHCSDFISTHPLSQTVEVEPVKPASPANTSAPPPPGAAPTAKRWAVWNIEAFNLIFSYSLYRQ